MNWPLFFFSLLLSHFFPDHLNNKTAVKANTPARFIKEIPLPAGYERTGMTNESFGNFLRTIALKEENTVYLYNGLHKRNQQAQYAVLNISIGNRDLQQCADAVMRLRAEYLRKAGKAICFSDNAGKSYCWDQYKNKGWQSYLETVFGMCGTLSLEKQLVSTSWKTLNGGDVLIKGGSPGHAVIVVDVARNTKTGELIYLLAQSYMPAQDIHVLKNFTEPQLNPWYKIPSGNSIITPEWTFYATQLRSWR